MTDKSKSEIRKHMLKTQNKLRINFFKKKLSVCTSGPTEENFTTLLRVFRRNSESFFFRLQKNLLDGISFKKNHSNCPSGQIGCSFVNQAKNLLNVWRFFRKFLKLFWWKKSCLEKMHPEKFLRMQISQSLRKFSEKVWNLPDQTRTPRLQTRNPVDIFSVKNWWLSRSVFLWKEKEVEISTDPTVFRSISRVDFFEAINSLSLFPRRCGMQFDNFSECFWNNSRSFAQIPKLVMSLEFIPKKTQMILGRNRMSFSKKMEVILSRMK